jgi:hypothetical protein
VRTQLVVRLLRAAVALLAATALTVNLIHASDGPSFRLIDYFSYFTNISNIFAVVVLAVGALRNPASRRWEFVRGAATFCTTVTGVIFALFMSDVSVGVTDPWINNVIHRVVPIFMLLDWWLTARAPVDPRQALRWLAIPIVYLAYTLIRGPLAGDWYPYPSSTRPATGATCASRSSPRPWRLRWRCLRAAYRSWDGVTARSQLPPEAVASLSRAPPSTRSYLYV